MVVGVARFDVYMSGNRSLKDKRRLVKSLVERTKARFPGLSVAEVDSLDLKGKATLGIAYVSNDLSLANSVLDNVVSYVESAGSFRMGEKQMEFIRF